MSNTVNDIPTGLRVPAQVPLDAKLYVADEASLINLGVSSNLAFTYYQGMIVYCVLERKRYEWREGTIGEIGLMPSNFTYPPILIVNGVDYSNKVYNFYIVNQNSTISNVGFGAFWYKGFNIFGNTHEFKSFSSYGLLITSTSDEINIENKEGSNLGLGVKVYKGLNSGTKLHEFRTLKSTNSYLTVTQVGNEIAFNTSLYQCVVQAGTGITVTGTGSPGSPYVVSLTPVPSPWLTGDIKEVYCTPSYMVTNFLQTGPNAGLGIGERIGWAICNGNNTTPNDNGKVIVAWGTSYPTLGATGGYTDAVVVTHNHNSTTDPSNNVFVEKYPIAVDAWNLSTAVPSGAFLRGHTVFGAKTSTEGVSGTNKNMQPYVVRLKIMKL